MMRGLLLAAALCVAVSAPPAKAQDAEALALCESMDRPNIDCACVARRVDQHRTIAPTQAGSDLVLARYAYALGEDGEPLDAVFQRVVSEAGGPSGLLDLERAFDQLGGALETIEEFEGRCVIEGAARAEPLQPAPGSPAEAFAASCVEAAGAGQARSCGCEAAMFEELAGPQGLEAYRLSFSLYPEDPSEDPAAIRAETLGVSAERYRELEQEARAAIGPYQERVSNHCSAMLWAEDSPGFDEAARAEIGAGRVERAAGGGAALAEARAEMEAAAAEAEAMAQDAGQTNATNLPDPARLEAAVGEPEAIDAGAVIAQGCTGSDAYCGCLAEQFESATAGASEGGRMLAAMTLVGDGLDEVTATRAARSVDAAAQAELAQLFPRVSALPGRCEARAGAMAGARAAEAAAASGSARERYLAVCAYRQGDDAASVCRCAADHLDASLSEDEFDLFVRIQAADLEGEAPLADSPELDPEEAARALATNPRLMEAMMGLQSACMAGGYP